MASQCAQCGKDGATLLCSGCLSVSYCGPACQRAHWRPLHKAACREIALFAIEIGCKSLDEDTCSAADLEKLIALSWTLREEGKGLVHVEFLIERIDREKESAHIMERMGEEVEGRLVGLASRALTELPWPPLPKATAEWGDFFKLAFYMYLMGKEQEALDIVSAHMEGVEDRLGERRLAAQVLCNYSSMLVYEQGGKCSPQTSTTHIQIVLERALGRLRDLPKESWIILGLLVHGLERHQGYELQLLPFAHHLLKIAPREERTEVYGKLAKALQRLCRFAEAEEAARQAITHAPNQAKRAEMLAVMAALHRTQGRLALALKYARRAVDESEGVPEGERVAPFLAAIVEADVLERMGRLVEARVAPSLATIIDANILERMGRLAEARVAPFLAAIVEADVLERMGRLAEARETDREYLAIDDIILPGASRRLALQCLEEGDEERAEGLLRALYNKYRQGWIDTTLSSICDPINVPRAIELLVGILRSKGTPEALKEVEEWRRGLEEKWKAALAEARTMTARGPGVRKGGEQSRRAKKKGKKGKGRRGRAKQRDDVEGLTEAMGRLLGGGGGAVEGSDKESGAAEDEQEDGGGRAEEEEEEECASCLSLLALGREEDDGDGAEELATLACGHAFHETCIESWVVASAQHQLEAQCPICRGTLAR